MGHDGHDDDHDHTHPAEGEAASTVATFVVHCSDSRREVSDETGRLIREMLESAGHPVVGHLVVRDDPEAIRASLSEALDRGAYAIIFTGGTGLGSRDFTFETLRPMFDKEITGFAQMFQYLWFQENNTPALTSRALAGVYRHALVFALPGTPATVKMVMKKLLLPELSRLTVELKR
jgi:molybdenum cofactor biosynthesis protein B